MLESGCPGIAGPVSGRRGMERPSAADDGYKWIITAERGA
jgi:hypothetical protein